MLAMQLPFSVFAAEPTAAVAETEQATSTNTLLRDPTAPLGYAPITASAAVQNSFNLSSVLISAQRKQAIINGATLREGQTIPASGGVVVKRIAPQAVVLQQGERAWTLQLSPSVVQRH